MEYSTKYGKIRRRVFNFGKVDAMGSGRKINAVEVTMELRPTKNGPELSVCGDVWNSRHTDIVMGGQCLDELLGLVDSPLMRSIRGLWKRNHLNAMDAAATDEQRAAVDEYKAECARNRKGYEYDEACAYLKKRNLFEVALPDGTKAKYGHGWYYRPISAEDMESIEWCLTAAKTEYERKQDEQSAKKAKAA